MFQTSNAFSSFSINDIQKAKQFYGKTLGLDVAETKEGLELKNAGGGEVFLYPKPNHEPATLTVLNFLVPEIGNAVAELTKSGVKFEHYSNPDIRTDEKGIHRSDGAGPNIAWFKDPAGNILSVIQPDR